MIYAVIIGFLDVLFAQFFSLMVHFCRVLILVVPKTRFIWLHEFGRRRSCRWVLHLNLYILIDDGYLKKGWLPTILLSIDGTFFFFFRMLLNVILVVFHGNLVFVYLVLLRFLNNQLLGIRTITCRLSAMISWFEKIKSIYKYLNHLIYNL